ncbi:oxidoreductase, short-chain dehydrogenase reductase family [Holzapfeliella floricola DSM 23037 = JCM 16512]|uniref:Oxidoreductase, short-chain dehydrogenase reductase family n=2 Tax=Holzapfeliella TaxID=2767883 RepID=A0A0R2DPB8_9LACO|nr:oxidoreductase, short-chain dehydrogenase reductase family [Holzapfeliella floricola DSM 23037 = JCM 16512]
MMKEINLENKITVITGASSGIGAEIAIEAARKNSDVVLIARDIQKLQHVQARIKQVSDSDVILISADMSNPDIIEQVYKKMKSKIDRFDYLVNAAGFGDFDSFFDMSMTKAQSMFDLNVMGLMYFTRLIGRDMMKVGSGKIINLGSVAGKIPTPKSAVYSATKAAVIQFSNVLRLELAPFDVKVMTVNPGPVSTNFFNIADKNGHYVENVGSFMLEPDELAQKVVSHFEDSKKELTLPFSLNLASKFYLLFPMIGDYIIMKWGDKK